MSVDGIVVAIPAKDEADRVAACIRSVGRAAADVSVPVVIVVSADHCADATIAMASTELARLTSLSSWAVLDGDFVTIGHARDAAVRAGLERLVAADPWIASTDADTVVPTCWLSNQLAWADAGVDAVAGLVDPDMGETPPLLRQRYLDAVGLPAADGSHPHVHGANLGVRAEAWAAAGGFSGPALAEDHALWHALGAVGARRRSVADLTVVTSGRLVSRVEGGFASFLAHLAFQAPVAIPPNCVAPRRRRDGSP